MQQVSIKESDRYTSEDRVWLALKGLSTTVLGIFFTWALWVAGWVASPTLILLFVGPTMMGKACFGKYREKIKILRVSQRECLVCAEGPVELYKEKIDTHVQRECFGRTRVTEKWAIKIHCMECGHKSNATIIHNNSRPVVDVPQVLTTTTESMDGRVSAKTINPKTDQDQENIPLATNVELV